ncbi:sigma-54-dependent Fis family transcriptional regulator [Thiohalocapsa marina]|uniref:Sigma-54-dependent Fis family transcriptional regulator n=1 Tax=Thiohalocapsa marina TaxID=424902 RepID=A0A5M8FV87_9GAMM|nr:sigma-54 dependent transcriptional regulator [Thiohalocapsa marina]KAA6187734.1 sigma-54-dependent Fis family transcriptional regulator [Thiohalocapsa marina]
MSQATVLIVDDEADIRELVGITCARMDVKVRSAGDLATAARLLEQQPFALCLTDMRLPDGDGTDLVRLITERYPATPVAMLTAYGSMDTAVAAMKAGAFDFLSKPLDLQVLRDLIASALRLRVVGEPDDDSGLLGCSAQMQEIRRLISRLARSQAPVFINGESGTGKELAARQIHDQGPRAGRPFVAINCGAIPADLVESELFGHRKGSFTGAVSDKPGLFQAAHGGTLFLDEIADLPLLMQVKLLRAVQQKHVRPIGSEREVPADARIISASHCDLKAEVERGTFREDLYYRINVIQLDLPPLRERPEDIPILARHVLGRISADSGAGPAPRTLSPEALAALQGYPFPGNVRELENILERATALCDRPVLQPDDLGLPAAPAADTTAAAEAITPDSTTPDAAAPAATPPDPALRALAEQPLEDALGEIEKQAILRALDATRWNRTAAAKRLGMTVRSLRYRLSKLGLDRPEP